MALKTNYAELSDITMPFPQIKKLFGELSIPYTVDFINDDIFHIILWHGSKKFEMRFVRQGVGDSFYLTGFLEG